MPELKERAKTLVELADAARFLARTLPLPMEPKAAALLTAESRQMLRDAAAALAATDFSAGALDAALRGLAEPLRYRPKGQGRCPWTPQRAERPFDPNF
jgi:glutamyl-tRNA synthetase